MNLSLMHQETFWSLHCKNTFTVCFSKERNRITNKDIKAGEELTTDYGKDYWKTWKNVEEDNDHDISPKKQKTECDAIRKALMTRSFRENGSTIHIATRLWTSFNAKLKKYLGHGVFVKHLSKDVLRRQLNTLMKRSSPVGFSGLSKTNSPEKRGTFFEKSNSFGQAHRKTLKH